MNQILTRTLTKSRGNGHILSALAGRLEKVGRWYIGSSALRFKTITNGSFSQLCCDRDSGLGTRHDAGQ